MAPTISRTHLDTLITHGRTAASTLREISDDDQNLPYLKAIGGVALLILDTVQNVRANKQQCFKMIEHINDIVLAIINICGNPGAELSPAMFRNISNFAETLQKVHTVVRNQVDMNIVHRIIRHIENEAQINECNVALQHAMDVFTIRTDLDTAMNLAKMKISGAQKHDELVEYLEMRSSKASIDRTSFATSSSSLSILLPAPPQIFRGREVELKHILSHLLSSETSRSAILGPGGIGKSSLALAALHSPEILATFGDNRFFIPLDSATSPEELLSLIAAYFGLEQHRKVGRAIIGFLSAMDGPSVLVLDNFESPWEVQATRSSVEDILSQLTQIPQLHIIITMRGAERPTKIRWTRPFLPPLETLDDVAARESFLAIVDETEAESHVDMLLKLTDNVPLAVTLLANITAYEGAESVLSRWSLQTTSLLSEGVDKRSNLDKSISLSLFSPRMAALPDARQLLSLLSLLPDGIPGTALTEMSLPFDVYQCRTTLVRTSLAYIGRDQRIKILAPIREYMRATYPPSP
ncbi:P-loop containing nucleoside triphosphate hydrolase protein [Mycena latifolia]|nr:P-loop containing nucleoside triphosphate hydrolase protein [Mycena latifolia]